PAPSPHESHTLSLHDALPISLASEAAICSASSTSSVMSRLLPRKRWECKCKCGSRVERCRQRRAKGTCILWLRYALFHNFFLELDRKSTRLNSSHVSISYAVF